MDNTVSLTRKRLKHEQNGVHSNGTCDSNMNGVTHANGVMQPYQYHEKQLYSVDSLPKYLSDNEYLLLHHRPPIPSIKGCARTAFAWHTETINIWSHFIGCIGSFILMVHHYAYGHDDFAESVWHLPFFLGAITCMGCSATYHTFLCYSEPVHKCLAKFDYCGIIVLIVSSFPPWLYFGFYCHKDIRNMYLVLIYSIGIVCALVILNDGLGKSRGKHFRTVRAALFMALGLSGLFPGLHYFYLAGYEEMVQYGSWLIIMALWYLAGGTLYAMRIPERIYPGKFDIVMHSHQFLHMFVIMGVISCFIGITKLAEFRRHTQYYCPADHM